MVSLLDHIPRDVSLIVYRYIHYDVYNQVCEQFDREFIPYWDDTYCYYHTSKMLCIANYRGYYKWSTYKCFIYDMLRIKKGLKGNVTRRGGVTKDVYVHPNHYYAVLWP